MSKHINNKKLCVWSMYHFPIPITNIFQYMYIPVLNMYKNVWIYILVTKGDSIGNVICWLHI